MKNKIHFLLLVSILVIVTGCSVNKESLTAADDENNINIDASVNEDSAKADAEVADVEAADVSSDDVNEASDEDNVYGLSNKEVIVDNVEDFVNAINDNTVIKLAPGEYNITQYIMADNVANVEIPFSEYGQQMDGLSIYNEFDGYQLAVTGFHDLTIESEDYDNPATIVCEPRYARVLEFINCVNISLRGVIMGHTPEEAYCTGSVVLFENCGNVKIVGCDLYGCGTYGFEALATPYILVKDSCIHDCSYGCAVISNSSTAKIINTEFRDCREFDMFDVYGASNVMFQNCSFNNLTGNMISTNEDCYLSFDDCTIGASELASIKANPLYGKSIYISGEEDYMDGMASDLSDEALSQQQSIYDWFNGIWLCSGKGYTITMTLNEYGQMSLVFKMDSGEIIKREGNLLLEWVGNPTGDYPPSLAVFGITDDPNGLEGVFTFEEMDEDSENRGISLKQVSPGESILSSITGEYAFYWKKIG